MARRPKVTPLAAKQSAVEQFDSATRRIVLDLGEHGTPDDLRFHGVDPGVVTRIARTAGITREAARLCLRRLGFRCNRINQRTPEKVLARVVASIDGAAWMMTETEVIETAAQQASAAQRAAWIASLRQSMRKLAAFRRHLERLNAG